MGTPIDLWGNFVDLWDKLGIGDKIIGAGVSMILTFVIITIPTYFIRKITNKKKSFRFRYVKRRKLKPRDIMHDRGEVINGFDAKVYFPREDVDDKIEDFLYEDAQTSSLLVVTGLLSSGKSRAVYETLKKSKVNKIALFPSDSNKEKGGNIEWTEDQWIEAISKLKNDDLIYIDSISDIKFKDAGESVEELIVIWKKIFSTIHSRELRCIVTLATMPQDQKDSFATTFLNICEFDPDKFTTQKYASVAIRIVSIPEIAKGDDFYKKCKSFLIENGFSPVVGDYVNNTRYYGSIWKEFNKLAIEHDGHCIRLFIAIMLTAKFNRNSIPCNYLKKVYTRLTEIDKVDDQFSMAYEQLERLKLFKMQESKNICVICGERSFEYIKTQLFDSLDAYHERKQTNNNYEPTGIVKWIEPYIRRNNNLHIEKKQAELIISIDRDNLSFYKDAVVFASPQNTHAVAKEVREKFNSHFFDLDQEKNPLKLKEDFKPLMEDICDFVGVLISRSCSTSSDARKQLNNYLKAGVDIHEDIICELLRIATEEDITPDDKNRIISYAFDLANKKYTKGKTNGVAVLLKQSPRFNTSYISVRENYDAHRIVSGFELHAHHLNETYNLVREHFEQNNENQLEPKSKKTYQKLWQDATSSLFYYCRKVTERLRSVEDLKLLLETLSTPQVRVLCEDIDRELQTIENNPNYRFVFINANESTMSNVVNSILAYNPLGYIGECKDMTVLLLQSLNNPDYKYIFNEKSIIYLIGTKESGTMGIIPDYKNAFDFYLKLKKALQKKTRNVYIENALIRCLYPLFDKIKTTDHFSDAKNLLTSPKDIIDKQQKEAESIIGSRKLVNALINNAPSYDLALGVYQDYQKILEGRIDTINILLGLLKKELQKWNLREPDKKRYVKYTLRWIELIRTLKWNKFSTDAARAKSILTSIKMSVVGTKRQSIPNLAQEFSDENLSHENKTITIKFSVKSIWRNIKRSIRNIIYYQRLSNKISTLRLPDESTQPESQAAKKINALKERKDRAVYSRKVLSKILFDYQSGEDIFEDSDYLTHLITFAYQDGQVSEREISAYREMLNTAGIDELISPKMEFYKQVLLKVFPKEEIDLLSRWNYVKSAYVRMSACKNLPPQRDKQLDLLFVFLRPLVFRTTNSSGEEEGDAVQRMSKEVYTFVKDHPVFITMFMASICKLADFYTNVLINISDAKQFERIKGEMQIELDKWDPTPITEDEIKNVIQELITRKLERINKTVMTLVFNNKPLPFDNRFAISVSKINKKLSEKNVGKWFVKGPSISANDITRHNAWDCYVEGKTNIDYKDLVPKVAYIEIQRICTRLIVEKKEVRDLFYFLNKELRLLKSQCTPAEYADYFKNERKDGSKMLINAAYTYFKNSNSKYTAKWSGNMFVQFSALCSDDKEAIKQWRALQPK